MKTGLILYVMGDAPVSWKGEKDSTLNGLADVMQQIEVVSRDFGHCDIHDAW